MSKCQMNKYKAGGRCGGSAAATGRDAQTPSLQAMGGALANLMAAREQQDRAFAAADAAAKVTSQAIVKQVAQPRPEKKECIDIILNGDF
jgi:hypothetical protein